jgi:hypothetical protein
MFKNIMIKMNFVLGVGEELALKAREKGNKVSVCILFYSYAVHSAISFLSLLLPHTQNDKLATPYLFSPMSQDVLL